MARRSSVLQLPSAVGVDEAAETLRANHGRRLRGPQLPRPRLSGPERHRRSRDRAAAGSGSSGTSCPAARSAGSPPLPLPFEARGGINAPGAWDVLQQRGAPGRQGRKVAVLDTGIAFGTDEAPLPQEPRLRPEAVPARTRLRHRRRHAARPRRPRHPRRRERSPSAPATTSRSPGSPTGARIIPVRVLDQQGFGNARDIADGHPLRRQAQGADVINMSFEFARRRQLLREDPAASARRSGSPPRSRRVVVVGGRQRERRSRSPSRPRAPHVIGVGADHQGRAASPTTHAPATGSTWSPRAAACPCSPTAAPTTPTSPRNAPIFQLTFDGPELHAVRLPGDYEGTSMAAAHVAGVAAMVIASRVLGRPLADQGRVPARGDRAQRRRPARPGLRPAPVRGRAGRRRRRRSPPARRVATASPL